MLNGLICWHQKMYCKKKKKKSYIFNALIWLFQNHNRKTCILHKPANYYILMITIFSLRSLPSTEPFSITMWELTQSELSPDTYLI